MPIEVVVSSDMTGTVLDSTRREEFRVIEFWDDEAAERGEDGHVKIVAEADLIYEAIANWLSKLNFVPFNEEDSLQGFLLWMLSDDENMDVVLDELQRWQDERQ